ncbi:hypothetical protein FQN54_008214 [Arachnomyces sp. PD_36]|nr:hypothetical protein FQN54_008214 [Arachnomyces sp. PD_36]
MDNIYSGGLHSLSTDRAISSNYRECRMFKTWSLTAVGTLLFLQHSEAHYHPIDVLIFDGKDKHQQWVAQATGSPNLEHAVIEYQRRYNRQPPPGFDKWYEFAAARSNLIIDDFDQIYEDLLPFQAMTPEHLRELTNQMVVNPSNNIAAVTIRDGTANIQEDILPTHRWMADGVAKMIAPFAEHLPDMDIALNLNDECMVAVPWEALDYLKSVGDTASTFDRDKPVSNAWSSDRASTWPSLNMTDEPETEYFVDYPFKRTFNRYAAQTCPPDSKARQAHFWDRHSLCVSCAHPHTLGQFVSDWSLAGDICHQPDLEHLHGFFLSPAAFSVSQLPMPVFSQSKVQGFNDILYPSAWNYIDKVKYDPSENQPDMAYPEKESTLVWRGATSEGVSLGGTWKGMTRQRLLHLVNNNTLSGVSVLLYSGDPKTYEYYKLDGTMPHTLLNLQTDAQIADKITRCVGGDCDPQAEELGIGDRIDFQDHWKYRFLFDMDGAGFSGRFLPFLQSHSVPFRTGLFRQWFDSRLTPWRHFVPIDVRLHDLWSTLAYFAGAEVTKEGEEKSQTFMKAHDLEGTLIAEEGRTWAEKVLRKEDMEIYFFRLLLEWGRLTDDRRDDLGFTTG